MRLKGNKFAALDSGESFIDVRFRPCQIVALIGVAFSYALVEQLADRFFVRREVAADDMITDPSFLIGGESDRHDLILTKTSRKITHDSYAHCDEKSSPHRGLSGFLEGELGHRDH